jgi:hypothetical protein
MEVRDVTLALLTIVYVLLLSVGVGVAIWLTRR